MTRASIPTRRANPCVHLGTATGDTVPCGSCAQKRAAVYGCAVKGRCVDAKASGKPQEGGIEWCAVCPNYESRESFQFWLSASGIGDAVCGFYAACGLADATGKRVTFKSGQHEWLKAASHPRVDVVPGGRPGPDANLWYETQMKVASQDAGGSRSQWYCDNLARHFKIPRFSPRLPGSVTRPEPVIGSGYVLISPFSAWSSRELPSFRWQDLAKKLHAAGERVIIVGGTGDGDRLRDVFGPTHATWYWGQSPAWALAAVSNAKRVIGNDSGIAHLGGLLRVPTYAVMSHLPTDFVFGPAAVSGIRPEPSQWSCQSCAWLPERGFRKECNDGCGALRSITADQICRSFQTTEVPQ